MSDQFSHGTVVTIHYAAEAPFLAQHLRKCERIGRGGYAVNGVEGAHDGRSASIHCCVERGKIELPQCVFGNFRAVVIAATLRSSITDVVLGAGSDAVRRVETLALIAANVSGSHLGTQERIFARSLRYSPPSRVASDIHHGRKRPANSSCRGFLRRYSGRILNQRRIPCRGQA